MNHISYQPFLQAVCNVIQRVHHKRHACGCSSAIFIFVCYPFEGKKCHSIRLKQGKKADKQKKAADISVKGLMLHLLLCGGVAAAAMVVVVVVVVVVVCVCVCVRARARARARVCVCL